jgi:hypothetical protein
MLNVVSVGAQKVNVVLLKRSYPLGHKLHAGYKSVRFIVTRKELARGWDLDATFYSEPPEQNHTNTHLD